MKVIRKFLNRFSLWYEERPLARGITTSIPIAGPGIHEYLMALAFEHRKTLPLLQSNQPYLKRLDQAFHVDHYLMQTVRALNTDTPSLVLNRAYKMILDGNSEEIGVDVPETLSYLSDESTSLLIRSTPPSPNISLICGHLDNDLISSIEFKSSDKTHFSIRDAELLWPCNCKVRAFNVSKESNKINVADCPIHQKDIDNEVSNLFGNEFVEINFDDISIIWKESDGLWPPSIDAFHLVKDIESSGIVTKNIKTIADIGSGTGFIGIWLATKYRSINNIIFSDWLLSPLILTALNSSLLLDDTLVKRKYYLGLGFNWINNHKQEPIKDLLICNPPYLPNLGGFSDLPLASTVFGTDLIEDVIRYGHDFAREVIISFSDLAIIEANNAAHTWGRILEPIGKGHRVPFRVSHAYDQDEYIKLLMDKRGLEYSINENFPLHHTIRTYRVLTK